MSPPYDPASTFNTFYNLLKELDGFIDITHLELSFNFQKHAFLSGPGFKVPLSAKPELHREMREEMRQILLHHLQPQNPSHP